VAIGVCAGIALGSTVYAAPVSAKEPEEEVLETIPAGFGCAFDVNRTVVHGVGNTHDITLTNAATGQSYLWMSSHSGTETYDPATNEVHIEDNGRVLWWFFPGDQGLNGEVQSPGEFVGLTGHIQATFDLDTELFTSFSHVGSTTDICAALSS
jgi:hypothetical protein